MICCEVVTRRYQVEILKSGTSGCLRRDEYFLQNKASYIPCASRVKAAVISAFNSGECCRSFVRLSRFTLTNILISFSMSRGPKIPTTKRGICCKHSSMSFSLVLERNIYTFWQDFEMFTK